MSRQVRSLGRPRSSRTEKTTAMMLPISAEASSSSRRGGAAGKPGGSAGAISWAVSNGSLWENSAVAFADAFAARAARADVGIRAVIFRLPVSVAIWALIWSLSDPNVSLIVGATAAIVAGAVTYSEYFVPTTRTRLESAILARGSFETRALPSYFGGSDSMYSVAPAVKSRAIASVGFQRQRSASRSSGRPPSDVEPRRPWRGPRSRTTSD